MNIVVIGSGMYVSGRGTDEYGAVMPAVCEWKRMHKKGDVHLVSTNGQRVQEAKSRIQDLQKKMKVDFPVHYYPSSNVIDEKAYQKIISEISEPKAAIIAVPDHLHYQIAKEVVENGFHALVAKPFVPTFEEALSLYELQMRKKLHCAVEFHKRYDEANLKLKEVFHENQVGSPLYFTVEFSQRKNIPSKNFIAWSAKTNVFQYLGVHYVDIIYFVTGAVPVRAMALGQKKWLIKEGIDNFDAVQGIVEWESAAGDRFLSYIMTHWIDAINSPALSDQKIKVVGSKGTFQSDQKFRGLRMTTDAKGTQEPSPYYTFKYHDGDVLRFRGYGIRSIQQFLTDANDVSYDRLQLQNIPQNCPSFKQALVSTAVVDAVNLSLMAGGKWEKIKPLGEYL